MALLQLTAIDTNAGVLLTNICAFPQDARYSNGDLTHGADGNFYGTTWFGGTYDLGLFFRVTPTGSFSGIVSFDGAIGARPGYGLVQDSDGSFYGAGGGGGCGTVFKVTTNGILAVVAALNSTNGCSPGAGVCLASDGNFYGTAFSGGAYDKGTIFKLSPDGVLTTLFSFNLTNGSYPLVPLMQGRDGKLYGTTGAGGGSTNFGQFTVGDGTIFSITTNGDFTSLFSFFRTNGSTPFGPLVQGMDGNFYGVTRDGGPDTNQNDMMIPNVTGCGTVFRITPSGVLTTLVWFNYTNGENPFCELVTDAEGNFYGTTAHGGTSTSRGLDGTIYKITPQGELTTLHSFDYNDPSGYLPVGRLAQGCDGNFYGTTHYNHLTSYGNIFRISVPLAPVFHNPVRNGNALTLKWSSVAGQTYQLQFATNLASTNWVDLGSAVIAISGSMSASDVIGSDAQRFYRVVLLP